MRRLFVLELNEVPLRVLRWHAAREPKSAGARLLESSAAGQSLVAEQLPRDLYPSQSWASLATGVPYADHQVFWYGDEKSPEFPLYWQAAAAAGINTGIVGTLHSSPVSIQCAYEGIRFALPDAFASDADTIPASLSALQAFNLDLVQANSRVVTNRHPLKKYLSGATSLMRSGISYSAARELTRLAVDVGIGSVPKERLRVGQFHLMADQFSRLSQRYDTQLSVLFSNHVASAMHRYWFASFPDDWDEKIYDDDWKARFADEIPSAMKALDFWLDQWMAWCLETDRTMLVISSMGQRGGESVDTAVTDAVVLEDPILLARALGIDVELEVGRAMVPQISYRLESEEAASQQLRNVRSVCGPESGIHIDQQASTLTVSYSGVSANGGKVEIGGRLFTLAEAGLALHAVEEHRAAVHDPLGSVLVFNSHTARVPDEPLDYLGIAPAILQFLGVDPLAHHREPGMTL